MKKFFLIVILSLFLLNCSNDTRKGEKEKLIQAKSEIKKIGKNPSKEEINKIYVKGLELNKIYPEISKKYFESIERYDARAGYQIALYYQFKNKNIYLEKLKKASDRGIEEASRKLGEYYFTNKEYNLAEEYRLKTLEQGNYSYENFDQALFYLTFTSNPISYTNKIENFLKKNEDNINIKLLKARYLVNQKKYVEAEILYKELIQESFKDNEYVAEELLGKFYIETEQYEKSEEYLLKTLKKYGNRKKTIDILFNLYIRTNSDSKIKKLILNLSEPEREKYLFKLAGYYKNKKKYNEAKKIYAELVKKDKKYDKYLKKLEYLIKDLGKNE